MGGSSSQFIFQTTDVLNDVIVNNETTCGANINFQQDNNRYIIDGSNANFNVTQSGTANASCYMANTISAGIVNDIKDSSDQVLTEQQSLLAAVLGVNLDGSNTIQETAQTAIVSNRISLITRSSCNANTTLDQSNNLLIVKNSTGNFSVAQNANANATCSMVNTSKVNIANSIANAATQTIKIINILAVIVIVIVVMIGACVVLALLLKARASRAASGEDTNVEIELQNLNEPTETD